MTVSEAVIKWLKLFNPTEYWKMQHIDTDLMHGDIDYALVKEPVRNVKTYLSGTKVITEHYMIAARLPNNTNADCVDNNGFGEALENWVAEQTDNGVMPEISDAVVKKVEVTTPFCVGKTETNNSIYQMTVGITYVKEK
ncbi:MAG: hypothetical protein ACI4EX_01825 [Lachnospiraceae bacterium]